MSITPLEPPRGVDSPLHAQGVLIERTDRLAFVSGQVGVRPDGMRGDGMEEQTRIAFDNISRVLAESDLGLASVAFLRIFLTSHDDIQDFSRIARERLCGHRPAATLTIVEHLADPALHVQIVVVAVG
jgi:enamine deaminase RidA (YjgF/YER057c/UK114 family)